MFHVFALDARHRTALCGHCDLMQSIGGLIGDPAVLSLTAERRIDRKTPGHKVGGSSWYRAKPVQDDSFTGCPASLAVYRSRKAKPAEIAQGGLFGRTCPYAQFIRVFSQCQHLFTSIREIAAIWSSWLWPRQRSWLALPGQMEGDGSPNRERRS